MVFFDIIQKEKHIFFKYEKIYLATKKQVEQTNKTGPRSFVGFFSTWQFSLFLI